MNEQFAGDEGAPEWRNPLRFIGLPKVQAQYRIEKRREDDHAGIGFEELDHAPLGTFAAGDTFEAEQTIEQAAPDVIRSRPFDRIRAGNHCPYALGHGSLNQVGNEPTLADAGITLEDRNPACIAGGQRFEALSQQLPLGNSSDDFSGSLGWIFESTKDLDRLSASLDGDWRQGLECDTVACRFERRQ